MKKIYILSVVLALALGVAGCGIIPPTVTIIADSVVPQGSSVILKAQCDGAKFSWATDKGELNNESGETVILTVPDHSGNVNVTTVAIKDDQSSTKKTTIEVRNCPLAIVDKSLNDQSIQIRVINNSSKDIVAYNASLVQWNSLGEPVTDSNGTIYKDLFTSDVSIEPDESYTNTWSLDSTFGAAKVSVWVYGVEYSDGSTWSTTWKIK